MTQKALFITFEGGEGAGKTTLIERLGKALSSKGYSVLTTREPGGTALGEEVRRLLLQPYPLSPYAELTLFLSSRAQHIAEVILPSLQQGKIVLCDRFNDSTIAYQGAARGLGEEQVEAFCSFISQGLVPDVTFYLDLDPEVAFKRLQREKDRIEQETLSFHRSIREAFLRLSEKHCKRISVLDASLSSDAVFSSAMQRLENL